MCRLNAFVETWGVKYDKAVKCLIKDRSRQGKVGIKRRSPKSLVAKL